MQNVVKGNLYLETSALLSWLFEESNADYVSESINNAENILTSTLTLMECQRVLIRAQHEQIINQKEYHNLLGLLNQSSAEWIIMEINKQVQQGVSQIFPIEPLRTLDAIHLVTALQFSKVYSDISVLSFDKRLIENATSLGFEIFD